MAIAFAELSGLEPCSLDLERCFLSHRPVGRSLGLAEPYSALAVPFAKCSVLRPCLPSNREQALDLDRFAERFQDTVESQGHFCGRSANMPFGNSPWQDY